RPSRDNRGNPGIPCQRAPIRSRALLFSSLLAPWQAWRLPLSPPLPWRQPLSPPLPWRQPLSPPLPSRPPPSRLPPSLRLREPPIPLPPPLLLRFPSPPSPSGVPHAPRHTSPAWLMPRSLPQRARLQPSTARPCARPLRRGAPDPARATSPL